MFGDIFDKKLNIFYNDVHKFGWFSATIDSDKSASVTYALLTVHFILNCKSATHFYGILNGKE